MAEWKESIGEREGGGRECKEARERELAASESRRVRNRLKWGERGGK